MKDDPASRAAESFSKSLQSNQWDFLPVIFGQFHNTKQDLYACVSWEITRKKRRQKSAGKWRKSAKLLRGERNLRFFRERPFSPRHTLFTLHYPSFFFLIFPSMGLDPSPHPEFIILLLSAAFLFPFRFFRIILRVATIRVRFSECT